MHSTAAAAFAAFAPPPANGEAAWFARPCSLRQVPIRISSSGTPESPWPEPRDAPPSGSFPGHTYAQLKAVGEDEHILRDRAKQRRSFTTQFHGTLAGHSGTEIGKWRERSTTDKPPTRLFYIVVVCARFLGSP